MLRKVILALLLFPAGAMAQDQFPSECSLQGRIVLQQDRQIICGSDLQVAPGTEILTNGHSLRILAIGKLVLNVAKNRTGLEIFAANPDLGQSHSGTGQVYIYAAQVSGSLLIMNSSSDPNSSAGDVHLEYMSVAPGYVQRIQVGGGAHVDMLVGGYPVALVGQDHQLASANDRASMRK